MDIWDTLYTAIPTSYPGGWRWVSAHWYANRFVNICFAEAAIYNKNFIYYGVQWLFCIAILFLQKHGVPLSGLKVRLAPADTIAVLHRKAIICMSRLVVFLICRETGRCITVTVPNIIYSPIHGRL